VPEAFSSIADMRIVIDSSTDKLEAGLTAAQNIVHRFATEGGQNLSLFDKATGSLAAGIEGVASKANLVLGAIEAIKGVIDSVGPVLETFAEQTGSEDQLEDLKTSAMDLQGAVLSGLKTAFDDVKDSALDTVGSILGFDMSAQQANASASSVAADGLKKLADGFDYVRQHIEDMLPESKRSLATLEDDVTTAKQKLQELQDQFTALQNMNVGIGGAVDQSSLDALKQEIAGLQTQIFVLNQLAGAERIVRDAKADRAVEQSKGIEALRSETEAMELNVETMKMSTSESALYRAELKARAALEEQEGLDEDAIERVIDKLEDRYNDASDALDKYNAAKKHDADAKQFLDQMIEETNGLRDRVAVLGMATVAAAAYTDAARNARALDKLGPLNADQQATYDTQLTQQLQLRLQLMADADQKQRQQISNRQNGTVDQTIQSMERQTASIIARTAALTDSSEAGRVEALVQQQITNLEARGIELSPQRIAQIRAEAQAQVEATEAQQKAQEELKAISDVGNGLSNDLGSAFRKFTQTGKFDFHDMALSIVQDMEQIAFKAAVLTPLMNLLTGGQAGGGGLIGQLLGIGNSGSALPSAASWAAGTSVIPAFADGGDFGPGPIQVGERGPELLWPTFPGKVIPNNALPNYASQQSSEPSNVEVNIINNSGAQVTQQKSQSGNKQILDLVIGTVDSALSKGKFDGSMANRYGAMPMARKR
jgi:hypothetical protein